MTILATAGLSIMRAVTQHLSSIQRIEEKTFASYVVDNVLAERKLYQIGSEYIAQKTGETRGETELASKTWYWKATPLETENGLLTGTEVRIFLDEDYKHSIISVISYDAAQQVTQTISL